MGHIVYKMVVPSCTGNTSIGLSGLQSMGHCLVERFYITSVTTSGVSIRFT